jgi:hypothetical protein
MNKFLKISLVLLTFVGFVSCDSSDDDTSFLNDRTPVSYFVPGSSATLLVPEVGVTTFDVKVGISEPKPFDRAFTYTIDPSSTAVENVDYSLSSTLVVPANSVVGTISVAATYPTTTLTGKTVKFKLVSVEDSDIGARSLFTLNIVRYCPLEAPFTGTYLLQNVSGGIAASGFSPAFGDGVMVELVEGDTDTERRFNVQCYSGLGLTNPPVDAILNFVCGNLVFTGISASSGIGCQGDPAIDFGPADTNSIYDPADDSMFNVNFTENIEATCGGDPAQSVFKLTKQ